MDALDRIAAVVASLPDLRGRGWLAHRWARSGPHDGDWTIRMRRGHRMVVPRSALQSWEAAFTGEYDDRELDLVRPHIAPGSTVLDVGASVGFWTVALACTTPAATVVAVEPLPTNVAVLERNVARNGVADRVSVRTCALGAHEGVAYADVEPGGIGNAWLVDEARAGGRPLGALARVEVRTLDSIELGDDRCSFVKLDVEGLEMDVLRGGDAFVARHRPAILGEFHWKMMTRRGVDPDAPLPWARDRGYDGFEVVRAPARRWNPLAPRPLGLVPVTDRRAHPTFELLLLPR